LLSRHSGSSKSGAQGQAFRAVRCLATQLIIIKEDKRKLEESAIDETKKKRPKAMSDADLAGVASYSSLK
jgi:hypothetical protein